MKRLRVYVDSSVIGGCLEPKFAVPSLKLLDNALSGSIILLVSTITREELKLAPSEVQRVLQELPAEALEGCPCPAGSPGLGRRVRFGESHRSRNDFGCPAHRHRNRAPR